jgi:hypothetical protein
MEQMFDEGFICDLFLKYGKRGLKTVGLRL